MQPSRVTLAPAAIIVAFAVPLLVSRHTLPLATFYGEWAAGLLGVLLVLVLVASRAPRDPSQQIRIVPLIALAPLWLIGTTLLQAASGMVDITGSRLMTDVMLALGAAVMAAAWWTGQGMSAARRETIVDALAAAFLIAGLLGTLAQWVQVFHLERHTFGLVSEYFHPDNRRLWGNLNQPNHQATVEGLALAASVWLAMRGKLRFPAWLVAVLLVESGIVLSGSRTGVVHVGIAVVYALLAATMARGERSANLMRRPATLVATAAIMAVMFVALMSLIKAAGLAFDWRLFDAVAQMHTKDQLSGRNALWAHAIAMFRAHPWLGVGYGEFGWAQFQQLAQVGGRPEMALHAHNAVLDLLAKTGAIGTVGVLVMLAAWLWRVVRQRLLHGERADRWQTVVVLVWLAMFAAHSMLEYPLHYLYFFCRSASCSAGWKPQALAVCAGAGRRSRWQPSGRSPPRSCWSPPGKTIDAWKHASTRRVARARRCRCPRSGSAPMPGCRARTTQSLPPTTRPCCCRRKSRACICFRRQRSSRALPGCSRSPASRSAAGYGWSGCASTTRATNAHSSRQSSRRARPSTQTGVRATSARGSARNRAA